MVSSSKPPSPWAIVLVAAILILVPLTACGGILFMSSSGDSTQGQGQGQGPGPAPGGRGGAAGRGE